MVYRFGFWFGWLGVCGLVFGGGVCSSGFGLLAWWFAVCIWVAFLWRGDDCVGFVGFVVFVDGYCVWGVAGLLKAWFWGGRFCWFFGDSFCRVCVAWFGLGFGVWVWLWWLLRWVDCLVSY